MLVARLGSVKAAAVGLGVSEPAVSGALATLRNHLGDPSDLGTPAGMALTPAVSVSWGSPPRWSTWRPRRSLRSVKPRVRLPGCGWSPPAPSPSSWSRRCWPRLPLGRSGRDDRRESPPHEMAALLQERLADVCFGPRLPVRAAGLESAAHDALRADGRGSPTHQLAKVERIPWRALTAEDWLVDPSGVDPSSEVGMACRGFTSRRSGSGSSRVTAAWVAAEEGEGVAPAISHLVVPGHRPGRLVRLDVASTPVDCCGTSVLCRSHGARRSDGALRFLATPEAMQSMHRSDGAVPASRFRPPVYVTLWS